MPNAPTILIIDADPVARQLIGDTLRREGYIVEERDSMIGYDEIDDLGCAMLVIDTELPGGKNAALIRSMRHHSATMYLPIIICSALDGDNDIIDGLNAGADDYITKPFSPATLLARVKSIMRRQSPYHAIG